MGHVAGRVPVADVDRRARPRRRAARRGRAGGPAPARPRDGPTATPSTRWLAGDWHGAARAPRRPPRRAARPTCWPCSSGTSSTSSAATPPNLRDRVAPLARPHRSRRIPTTAFVRGMYAFGLEESGHYQLARGARAGRRRRQPRRRVGHPRRRPRVRDAGPGRRGHRLPAPRARPTGRRDNMFTVHNWWHLALFLLEAGRADARPRRLRRPRSTTPARPACRSRCSTPARCCGGCCSTASPPATGSPRWPTPGRPAQATDALVRLQRRPRHDGVRRRRPPRRRAPRDRTARALCLRRRGPAEVTNVAMTAEIGLPASRAVVATAAVTTPRSSSTSCRFEACSSTSVDRRAARRVATHVAQCSDQVGRARPCGRSRERTDRAAWVERLRPHPRGRDTRQPRVTASRRAPTSVRPPPTAGGSPPRADHQRTARAAPCRACQRPAPSVGSDLLRHSFSCRPRRVVTEQ